MNICGKCIHLYICNWKRNDCRKCNYFINKEDVMLIIHAKWVNRRRYYNYHTDEESEIMNCSNCEETVEIGEFSEPYLYCPECGAIMDEE